jgi:hypothetical protein
VLLLGTMLASGCVATRSREVALAAAQQVANCTELTQDAASAQLDAQADDRWNEGLQVMATGFRGSLWVDLSQEVGAPRRRVFTGCRRRVRCDLVSRQGGSSMWCVAVQPPASASAPGL